MQHFYNSADKRSISLTVQILSRAGEKCLYWHLGKTEQDCLVQNLEKFNFNLQNSLKTSLILQINTKYLILGQNDNVLSVSHVYSEKCWILGWQLSGWTFQININFLFHNNNLVNNRAWLKWNFANIVFERVWNAGTKITSNKRL